MKAFMKTATTLLCAATIGISFNSFPAFAESTTSFLDLDENTSSVTSDKRYYDIKTAVESFFENYEKAVDQETTDGSFISKYFVHNRDSKTLTNMALIDAMLYQNICSKKDHLSGIPIKELNKKLSFDYSVLRVTNDTALVDVCVTKEFNYNICPDVDSVAMDRYIINLCIEKNEWKISYIDNFIPEDILIPLMEQGFNFENINSIKKYKNSIKWSNNNYNDGHLTEKVIQQAPSNRTTYTYNSSGACSYANTYVFSPNPNYFNLESTVGDCTNFASQVLNEGGGIPEHFGSSGYNNCWFYTNSSNRSTSWAGANYLYDYMHSSSSMIDFYDSNWSSVVSGDLIQVKYYGTSTIGHSMIITGVVYSSSGRSDLLVTYRSVTNGHKKNILLSSRNSSETRYYMHINGGV